MNSCCIPSAVGRRSIPPGERATFAAIKDFSDSVLIVGGMCDIGTPSPHLESDGEGPPRRIRIPSFLLERFAVSNAKFLRFVEKAGYQTDAEKFGWSYVFSGLLENQDSGTIEAGVPAWWRRVAGASWKTPEGLDSSIADRLQHPAIHISWRDAEAYAVWAGGRLPTEAEWECAAKGGKADAKFPWGNREPDDHFTPCNIWQGDFPAFNSLADGYLGTSPVDSFAPNGFGLFNMCGNVWEWCSDPFLVRSLSRAARQRNVESRKEKERVLKGGSYLCHKSYCYRYRIAARSGRSPDTSAGHTGFRIAYDIAANSASSDKIDAIGLTPRS